MQNNDIVQLFQRLGLTEYESKTLSALLKLKEAKAPELSRLAEVPKTRVYDVLEKLMEKNLVIEMRGRPKRYRIQETEKIFDALIEEKRKELNVLLQAVDEAKRAIRFPEAAVEKGSRVLRVKDIHDLARILAQEIQTAKSSVIGFAEVLPKHSTLKKAIQELRARNVSVRLLHPNIEELAELAKKGIDLKEVEHGLEAYIIDDKKLVIALSDLKDEQREYSFAIWHDAPIIEPLKKHFEHHWLSKQ